MCRQSFWICVSSQLISQLHLCLFLWFTFSVYGISSSTCLVGWSENKKQKKKEKFHTQILSSSLWVVFHGKSNVC